MTLDVPGVGTSNNVLMGDHSTANNYHSGANGLCFPQSLPACQLNTVEWALHSVFRCLAMSSKMSWFCRVFSCLASSRRHFQFFFFFCLTILRQKSPFSKLSQVTIEQLLHFTWVTNMDNAQDVQKNMLMHTVTPQNCSTLRTGRNSIHLKKGLRVFYTFVQVFNQDIGLRMMPNS